MMNPASPKQKKMDATTIASKSRVETPLEFNISVESDAEDGTDALLPSKGGQNAKSTPNVPTGLCSCFQLAYYQPYFDVDTSDIKQRFLCTLLPFKGNPTFMEIISEKPDAYGPFWITSTLIFCLASCSNLASWLDFTDDPSHWRYNFNTVGSAITLLSAFLIGLPCILWGIGKAWGCPLVLSSLFCLYGYSLLVFIPATIICVLPNDGLDWLVLLFAMIWSLFFVLKNQWPSMREHIPKEKTLPLLGFIGCRIIQTFILLLMKT